jgi:hypothetical protein
MEIVHRNFGEATLSKERKIHKIQLANDPFNKVKGQVDAFDYFMALSLGYGYGMFSTC